MNKKFPNITYVLSDDVIIINGEKMVSLVDYSLIMCISNTFKKLSERYNWSEKLSNARGLTSTLYKVYLSFEDLIEDKVLNDLQFIPFDSKFTISYIKQKIKFMGMQIVDFLTKGDCFYLVNMAKFLDNVIFTCQGTINKHKSVLQLLKKFSDFPYTKFRIMCHHFFGEIIKTNYEKLPDFSANYFDENMAKDYFLQFWMWEIKTPHPSVPEILNEDILDTTWFAPYVNDSVLYVRVFFKAIETNNEIAVEYLWTNKISEFEERERILERALNLAVKYSIKTNIMMYLLFQVYENELDNFFNYNYFSLIQNIVKNVRWHCVFFKIYELVKRNFDLHNFLKIFRSMSDSHWENNYIAELNLDLIVNFFSSLPELAKAFIVNDSKSRIIRCSYGTVFSRVCINKREDLLKKLTKFNDDKILKTFFNSDSGVISLTEITKKGCLNFMYSVMIGSDKDLNEKKLKDLDGTMCHFFRERKDYLCRYFIENRQFNMVISFVDFFSNSFISFIDISKFKLEILYMLGGTIIREILFPSNKILSSENLKTGKFFLIWCLRKEEIVDTFKKYMNLTLCLNRENDQVKIVFYDKIRTCVLTSQWKYLSEFFDWKGIETEEKSSLLQKLMNDEFLIRCVVQMDDTTTFLYNFIEFLSAHNVIITEINIFKETILSRKRA
ncbi:UNVERIFIED_CONTAM: hypothetical protein RMT77_011336 [Armadillidium vulgare]